MTINEMHSRLKNIVQNNPRIKQEIENAFLQSNTSLEYLLNLCKIITNKITIWQQTYYDQRTQQHYQLYLGRRKKQQDITIEQEKEIMIYATQFIYAFRSFITDTDIDFLFGVSTEDGTQTISAIIPQDEMLTHLKATRKNAIGVTTSMQTALIKAQQTGDIAKQRIDHWKIIESLATPEYDTNAKYKYVRSKSGRAHRAYQSQKEDFKVYLSFFGKQPMKYYGDSLIYFNNGWLWEWYNNFYYNASDTEYAELEATLNQGSIEPLIQNTDFIRGTKQGDFYIAQHQQEVQAKYNNIKIISYNNIREIIYELQGTLLILQNDIHSSQGYTQLYNILDKHFIPEAARIGLDYMSKSTTKLIQDFQNNIKRY